MKDSTKLPRRSFLAVTAWSLASCGGGMGGFAGLPGTGGTGIFSIGAITGFGSVIVNGVKFDDGQALVWMDGIAATSANLRLGMLATVQGVRGATTALGTANSIEVWSAAQGVISQVVSGQFTFMGMTVQTDSATVFEGVSSAAALAPGLPVAVWGLQASADGSQWIATRVAIMSATAVVASGLVSVAGSQRYLNGLLLTGTLASSLNAGQLIRVQGILSVTGNSIQVTTVKRLDGDTTQVSQGETGIEGVVTATPSVNRLVLGSIEVDTSAASFIPSTLQVTIGARLEVHGTWQAGVLRATAVEVEDELSLGSVEIEAPIEQFTSVANFMVRGQRCDASGVTTVAHGTLADLRVGLRIHLKGSKFGDVVNVTQLEIET
jgi:Domain of unknown function (DUF5666)